MPVAFAFRSRRILLGASLLMLVASCAQDERYELVLGLQTDLAAGVEFDELQLSLYPQDATQEGARRDEQVGIAPFLPGRRVAELGDLAAGDYRLDVLLRDRRRGRVVAERPVLLSVRENLSITVPISRSCLNVACPPTDDPATPNEDESLRVACFDGACVLPECTVENPEACLVTPRCDETNNDPSGNPDCPTTAACAVGECLAGACWSRSRAAGESDACSENQWCDPERGCFDVAPGCADGIQGPGETGIDCGGDCSPCDATATLFAAECRNGLLDPGETAIDCGGSCTPCPSNYDCSVQQEIPVHECLALVGFFDATIGSGWSSSSGWLTQTTPCTWQGITCANGQVDTLRLTNNQLRGALPAVLGNLRGLRELVLNGSQIGGSLPAAIGELENLEKLSMDVSRIGGSIPPEIGRLGKLRELVLSIGKLTGPIPAELGDCSELEILSLFFNGLTGPIPAELGKLRKLQVLRLGLNGLSGPLPAELATMAELRTLDLSTNSLSGAIPSYLGGYSKLENLILENNVFIGEVPTELQSLPLRQLRLSNNACLWTSSCGSFKTWLDQNNGTWSDTFNNSCSPPSGTCQ